MQFVKLMSLFVVWAFAYLIEITCLYMKKDLEFGGNDE